VYGNVSITVSDGVHNVTGAIGVSIQPLLILSPPINNFQEATIDSSGSSGSSSSASVFVVVGVVVGVVVLGLMVAFIVIRRRRRAAKIVMANEPFYDTVGNTSTSNMVPAGAMEDGVDNPMYGWYRPDLSRQEAEEFLVDQVEGAFVIRDSSATPGWHMLAVKTHTAIVHEKIKMNGDGLYELLPSSAKSQPRFADIGQLVEHYSTFQDGVKYALALDNPMYDNNQMAHVKRGGAVSGAAWSYHNDPSAPAVPLKEREMAAVKQLVGDTGDEIYTNAEEAKAVVHASC
jgi:hypothetical protein